MTSAYDSAEIAKLLDESDKAKTTKEKGAKLEALARYLFEAVPGMEFFQSNILDSPGAHEIDVTFWNPPNLSQLSFLDSVLMVECKNHGTPIGSAGVGWFITKLRDRSAFSGILISLNGVTGNEDDATCAEREIYDAMVRDRIRVFVITRKEIIALSSPDDLVSLLKNKYLQQVTRRIAQLSSG